MDTRDNILDKKMWNYYSVENPAVFLQSHPRLHLLAQKALKLLKKGRLLDIGIGDGFLFEAVQKKNPNISFFGIDITENMPELEKSFRAKGIDATLKHASIDQLPFSDNFFDIITASEVLEHLDDKTLAKGLQEVARVLKPGGFFLATTPYHEDINLSMCHCPQCGHSYHHMGHKQSFSEKRLHQLFAPHFSTTRMKCVTFFSSPQPSSLLKKAVYRIKFLVFHMVKYVIGSYFSFYIQSQK